MDSAYGYEAKNLQVDIIFCGATSSLARSEYGATKETMMEAVLTAKIHGFFSTFDCAISHQLWAQVTQSSNSQYFIRFGILVIVLAGLL